MGPVTGLQAVVGPGAFLMGTGGDAWEVASADRGTAARWRRGDRIEVRAGRGAPPFADVLVNRTRRQHVAARAGRRLD